MVQRIAEMRESGLLPPEAPFVPTATEAEDVPWLKFQDQEVKPLRDQDIGGRAFFAIA